VKVPVFSFNKLEEVDISLGPEMKSTGEVLGIDASLKKAIYKGLLGAGVSIPAQGTIVATVADKDKNEALPMFKAFYEMGFQIVATEGTSQALEKIGIKVQKVKKIKEGSPNIVDLIRDGQVDFVVNTLTHGRKPSSDGFLIRRAAVELNVPCLTSLDTLQAVLDVIIERETMEAAEIHRCRNMSAPSTVRTGGYGMPLEKGLVIVHNRLSHDMYQLEFISPEMAARSKPGQFLQVKVNALNTPLLRRPISIYDVDKSLGSITLLYKVVGQGTEAMSRIRTKEYLDVMGPLGQGFNTSPPGRKILLIGGGVGIAPLVYLARVLKAKNYQVKVLHGADSRRNLVAFEKLREIGVDFLPATDDGSAGFKGLVTDLLATKLKASQIDYILPADQMP
jgi:NAD(P)H-flavin reductase